MKTEIFASSQVTCTDVLNVVVQNVDIEVPPGLLAIETYKLVGQSLVKIDPQVAEFSKVTLSLSVTPKAGQVALGDKIVVKLFSL